MTYVRPLVRLPCSAMTSKLSVGANFGINESTEVPLKSKCKVVCPGSPVPSLGRSPLVTEGMASGFLHLILGLQATLFGETDSLVSDFLHLVLGFHHLVLGFQAPFLGGTDGLTSGFLHLVLGFQAPCWVKLIVSSRTSFTSCWASTISCWASTTSSWASTTSSWASKLLSWVELMASRWASSTSFLRGLFDISTRTTWNGLKS
ncbi:hypothetical protein RchiOBHm_Chr4g0442241 [Rosa chinensis]|uniref:Uncharacterized protein n=1 Tax=Rosa chinensis TaxID=74649 RepID=A0A2P6R3K1_ROSCH|nr:hypothetical protein RchiOBHm_Chr4g0442241 [Rosa chinensis]